ncbi:helicase 2 [Callinectes sapidus nudivirus]|nr:helicase 2 [Callinectes sapidus nudivirus]
MNPIANSIILLLKQEIFTSENYFTISKILQRSIIYLKSLKTNTIKEMLYSKIKQPKTINIMVKEILELSESDCKEYNSIHFNDYKMPDFKLLKNVERSKLILSILNEEQRKIAYAIFEQFSCSFNESGILVDPKIILLDAESGTGKSFLIDCLATCMRNLSVVVIAKNATLLNSICSIKSDTIKSMTTCKFTMLYFDMDFNTAINVFRDSYKSIEDVKVFIDSILKNRRSWDFNLLIIDEYSMEPPLLLVIITIVAKLENVNLLIMGDIKQQNSLSPSRFHAGTNYKLLSVLSNIVICKLSEQMRIKDDTLLDTINEIKAFIDVDKGNMNNCYAVKFLIFCRFMEKFVCKSNILEDIFLTDTHKNIKKRVVELIEFVKQKNIVYKLQKFELKCTNTGKMTPFILPNDYKYLSELPLIEGCRYTYNKQIVTLNKIHHENQQLEMIDIDTQEKLYVSKSIWNKTSHACVDDNFNWMQEHIPEELKSKVCIIQYPIRLLYFTYYFVQGFTFGTNQNVTIDLDASLCNSLYVGFSRIKESSQISEIKSVDFLGLLYTRYKNDGYFYKIKKGSVSDDMVDNLKQFFINKYHKFDDSKYNFKEVPSYIFEKALNATQNLKTKQMNNLKRKMNTEEIRKKNKIERSELSVLLHKKYYNQNGES